MWRDGRRPGRGPGGREERLGERGESGAGWRSGEQGKQLAPQPQPGAGANGLGLGVAAAAAVCAAAGAEGVRDCTGLGSGGRGRAGPLREGGREDERHLGFYGVQKTENQLQARILLFLSNYTIKRLFSGVSPPPYPPNWKFSNTYVDNAGLLPSKFRMREI